MQELLRKYDTSGPRYTSYPPAPLFKENFPKQRYGELLEAMASGAVAGEHLPLSLYFHLPFCDTLCYFCGCTMLVSNDRRKIHEYVEYLKREIDLVAARLEPGRFIVTQMHWGGGSPTHLLPEEIIELGDHIRSRFDFDPSAEISIEVDPRGFETGHARALQHVGFNRASVGVQDFFPDTQWAVNRIQPYEMTRDVIKLLRSHGMKSINIDLIYGLPYQTIGTFRTTIDQVVSLDPDRLAAYNFAYVPWVKPHQKVIQIDTLPAADKKIALQYTTIEKFREAGFDYIGMDHYARHNDELAKAQRNSTLHRNFQGYSTKSGTRMIGMGMSAIGKIYGTQTHPTFIQNFKSLDTYYAALDAGELPVERGYEMTIDDRIRDRVISEVMCHSKVEVAPIEREFEIDFEDHLRESIGKLEPMIEDRLIEIERRSGKLLEIKITKTGKLFLRNIAMCFDATLPTGTSEKPLYSKTL